MVSDDQETPAAAYRGFIDRLVYDVRPVTPPPASDEALRRVTASLEADGRAALAEVLQAERDAAIHDVLAELSWQLETERLELRSAGKAIDVDAAGSGMGLNGDFVGRRDGWDWPADG